MRIPAQLSDAARRVASWWLATAAVLAALGFAVDGALLAVAGAAPSSAIGGALAAAALGALLALPASIGLAATAAAVGAAARRLPRPQAWRFALVAAVAAVPAWLLLEPPKRAMEGGYVLLVGLTALAVGLAAWLSRAQPPVLARAAAGLLAAAAIGADVWLSPTMYLELHNIAHLVAAAALLAAATPLRERFAAARPIALGVAAAATVGVALGVAVASDDLAPGWRSASLRHGRHATRLTRGLRAIVDRDGDGYSPIAWGGDCDDGDAARHPLAGDAPGGGDANCNGVDPPADPDDAALGLAPARGAPRAAAGEVDLVVLVTIDTIRADAVVADVMPRLSALAERGARFERGYAAGSSTRGSLPLMQRVDDGAPLLAETLADAGIVASAVYAAGMNPKALGYERIARTADKADAVTDAAIARIRQVDARRHFVWVHYYDPHQPTFVHRSHGVPAGRPDLPEAYRSELAFVDRELGRLVDALEADGRLSRAAVIVTGDHGEGFGEHGVFGHSRSGYDVVLRVPMIFVAPGVRPGRYDQLATHRDLPPTILGLFGLPPAERAGRSWLRLRAAPDDPLHTFVVARSDRFSSGRDAHEKIAVLVRADDWKLVAGLEERILELYDLERDPTEVTDRTPDEPALAQSLWRALATYCDLDHYPRRKRE